MKENLIIANIWIAASIVIAAIPSAPIIANIAALMLSCVWLVMAYLDYKNRFALTK